MTSPQITSIRKPLFIPLMAKYYEQFERGEKHWEFRPYGPRWNENTCPPGREAVLSYGYGKKRRMRKVIRQSLIIDPSGDFVKIYGTDKKCFGIEFER